ncbi:MAG: efflux RND transporter periplasmic adaptor subunit [Candidatus Binataceae bacterium]
MRSRGWMIGAAALIVLAVAVYFHGAGRIRPGLLPGSSAGIGESATFRVQTIAVPRKTQVIGGIESRAPVEVSSNISARVREISVGAGQHITRGEILVQLDSTSLVAELARARGARSAALAELTRTEADWHRYSALYSRGSATAQERDAAQAAYSSASATEQQAAATISGADSALAYATVRSPVDGIVVDRMVEPGDMAMPGKPLLRIYGTQGMRAALAVPEGLLGSLRLGAPIRISVGAVHRDFTATISEIIPAANAQSGSVTVRANLPTGAGLQPGMFARAAIPGTSEALLTIPRSAVQAVGQLNTVRVLSNGSVELRQVALGRPIGAQVEVLAGLSAGETVLLEALPNPIPVVHQ